MKPAVVLSVLLQSFLFSSTLARFIQHQLNSNAAAAQSYAGNDQVIPLDLSQFYQQFQGQRSSAQAQAQSSQVSLINGDDDKKDGVKQIILRVNVNEPKKEEPETTAAPDPCATTPSAQGCPGAATKAAPVKPENVHIHISLDMPTKKPDMEEPPTEPPTTAAPAEPEPEPEPEVEGDGSHNLQANIHINLRMDKNGNIIAAAPEPTTQSPGGFPKAKMEFQIHINPDEEKEEKSEEPTTTAAPEEPEGGEAKMKGSINFEMGGEEGGAEAGGDKGSEASKPKSDENKE